MNKFEKYIEYIKNVGGNPTTKWFDEDFEPIGPSVRDAMVRENVTRECDGVMFLMTEDMI